MKPIQQASSLPEREKRAANFWGLWSVVLCALPLISFGLSLISWLSNGVDLPNYDDWRFLDNENLGKFSLSRFLTIGGGTLAPVGYFWMIWHKSFCMEIRLPIRCSAIWL